MVIVVYVIIVVITVIRVRNNIIKRWVCMAGRQLLLFVIMVIVGKMAVIWKIV